MTTTKTAKTPRTVAAADDAEIARLVTEAERSFAQSNQAHLVDRINADTRGVLTLFPYTPRNPEPGKTYPAMTGHLDTKNVKIPVSAFAKMTEEGREFLSLAIGPKGQNHIGGAVFRSEEQSEADGLWTLTPGKENDRHGVIAKTRLIDGTDEYETVFELRFYGRRRLSGAGVPFIKAKVYAERRDGEATEADMAGCF